MKHFFQFFLISMMTVAFFAIPLITTVHADSTLVFCNTGTPNKDGQFVNSAGKSNECGWPELIRLIQAVIRFLIIDIGLPVTSVVFAWSGFKILTAAGNSGQVTKAKEMFRKVVVGFVLALSAWVIVNTILTALVCKNTPGQQCDYSILAPTT